MSDGLFKCLFDDHNRVAEQLHEMGWRAPNDAQWSKLKIWCEGISLDWELMSLSRDASRHDASDLRSKLAVAVEALERLSYLWSHDHDDGIEKEIVKEALAKIRS